MKHTTLWLTEIAFNNVSNGLAKPHISLVRENNHVYLLPTLKMVDLGLPLGTLWAKTNLGAQTETDYGQYFQWAATTPLHVEGTVVNPAADWDLCPYCTNGETFIVTKYTGSDYTELLPIDDAANVILGNNFKIPNKAQVRELINNTTSTWVENFNGSGVNGYKFMKINDPDTYIFLPASGWCSDEELYIKNSEGTYWTSELFTSANGAAHVFGFNDTKINQPSGAAERKAGLSIRPIVVS